MRSAKWQPWPRLAAEARTLGSGRDAVDAWAIVDLGTSREAARWTEESSRPANGFSETTQSLRPWRGLPARHARRFRPCHPGPSRDHQSTMGFPHPWRPDLSGSSPAAARCSRLVSWLGGPRGWLRIRQVSPRSADDRQGCGARFPTTWVTERAPPRQAPADMDSVRLRFTPSAWIGQARRPAVPSKISRSGWQAVPRPRLPSTLEWWVGLVSVGQSAGGKEVQTGPSLGNEPRKPRTMPPAPPLLLGAATDRS
jgi:hypothetical protein